jgi:hypothetical protein
MYREKIAGPEGYPFRITNPYTVKQRLDPKHKIKRIFVSLFPHV